MKVELLILFAFIELLFSACNPNKDLEDNRPNIILIVADDLGIGSVSVYNSDLKISTPNIDDLARQGWKFDQFYVTSPVCSPSRASIMTGLDPDQAMITDVLRPSRKSEQNGLDNNLLTISSLLKKSGYETALVGKWHLGYKDHESPGSHGFDRFYGFLNGHIDYISYMDPNGQYVLTDEYSDIVEKQDVHLTELLTDKGIEILSEQKSKPMFLMLSYANPHVPILLPGEEPQFPGSAKKALNSPSRYLALVKLLDNSIGRLMSFIEESDRNTAVIFISDHGCPEYLAGNYPYAGGKGTLFEGGLRIPAILNWPEKLTSRAISSFYSTKSLLPTIAEIADIDKSNYQTMSESVFTEDSVKNNKVRFVWSFNGVSAARHENYKALFIQEPEGSDRIVKRYLKYAYDEPYMSLSQGELDNVNIWLFNLESDPYEKNNLAADNKKLVEKMWKEIQNSKYIN